MNLRLWCAPGRASRHRGCGRACRALLVGLALLQVAGLARADGGHHALWAVSGRHNTVYLLGSVHVLRPEDSALPDVMQRAYARARKLVMEVDPGEARGIASLADLNLDATLLPPGESLQAVLGADLYARFSTRVRQLGLDPEFLDRFQPWFAALTLEQLDLTRSGYDASAGVDLQLAARAQADHKPIVGLETLEQQLGFFAALTPAAQRSFLEQTLDESGDEETEAIVRAWERGDAAGLAVLARRSAADAPELFRLLTAERNRRWLPRITALLGEDEDCLVVVGALHLVGSDGLVALLERRGYRVVQQ